MFGSEPSAGGVSRARIRFGAGGSGIFNEPRITESHAATPRAASVGFYCAASRVACVPVKTRYLLAGPLIGSKFSVNEPRSFVSGVEQPQPLAIFRVGPEVIAVDGGQTPPAGLDSFRAFAVHNELISIGPLQANGRSVRHDRKDLHRHRLGK